MATFLLSQAETTPWQRTKNVRHSLSQPPLQLDVGMWPGLANGTQGNTPGDGFLGKKIFPDKKRKLRWKMSSSLPLDFALCECDVGFRGYRLTHFRGKPRESRHGWPQSLTSGWLSYPVLVACLLATCCGIVEANIFWEVSPELYMYWFFNFL